MPRSLYVMIPKPQRGKGSSLQIISASPCLMRMPAPCGTLWGNREICDQARTKNDSLRADFVSAEVIVFLREEYDALAARVRLLEKKLRDAGIDPEE
jgi:hypothetical protein